ncbi:type VI secretion system Vgr family protein [Gilliamella sp. B2838]|uniref:type VI secretion system Vgr family protein n=1 Tax=Gilliamella sp. B2838 TaxID=2818020 RepID=UPI0022698B5E|nr:type VI secretion system Vgr family protein [Gilliamella sp. B2838]MCX8726501.1 type VI secretion system tip protein VgrG [Gilliamella sp. B2838]
MVKAFNQLTQQLGEGLLNKLPTMGHNRYTLMIDGVSSPISILQIKGDEQLNQPWHYAITFTSSDKGLLVDDVLNQPASFIFNPISANALTTVLSSLSAVTPQSHSRVCYGIITAFNQLSVNKDEARYEVVLSPRLSRLSLSRSSAIFQNQSVVSVVEEVLRSHGFTGVDYRLELKESYPARELITQWQESDLEFIQRLLSDVGIWFRFESHAEHHCDVLVMSDYEQGFENAGKIPFKAPSDMIDGLLSSIWDLQLQSKMVERDVTTQDYNYRLAEANQHSNVNSLPQDNTTFGTDYRYGEHYKEHGDDNKIESGQWYAKIRHQHYISDKVVIHGCSNDYTLTPGQRIIISENPINGLSEGIIILTTQSLGNRSESYQLKFTAIPYNPLKPYRPIPLPWPQVAGTVPARVTSPDNDTYGYLDTQGRYRVKFNFDLKNWKPGEESLWVRLAKPYAGSTYGFHFPLIEGTEVAIAFTDGNPDRPYISHAMHDSAHPDHVATANKHRNVIRTPANNKLRMDDKRGQEHIKLATEYGKTQLNIGHLVNEKKEQRGEGFELRSDEWGAIRAGKGLYITSEEQSKASNVQLQMDKAINELQQACELVKRLNELAQGAEAELADLQSQKQLLEQSLQQLKQPAIVNYAPSGIANVTPSSIQQTAGENIIQTAQNSVDISTFKRFMVTAGNMISLFANKMGIKIFASKGNIDIQAQNNEMLLTSKQNMKITSTDNEVIISANKKLTLTCDGVGIVLEEGSIKLIAPGDVQVLAASFNLLGPSNYSAPPPVLPAGTKCREDLR